MIPVKGTSHSKRPIRLQLLIISAFTIFHVASTWAGNTFPYSSEPVIRVCLAENLRALSLRVNGDFRLGYRSVTIAEIADSKLSFRFSHDGTPEASLPNQELTFSSSVTIEPPNSQADASRNSVASQGGVGLIFGSQTYPGSIEIIPEGNKTFRVVNSVALETYLRGVVPNELVNNISPDEFQACMAQAIAARNFAIYKMSKQFVSSQSEPGIDRDSSDFDVYSDTRDQVYSGMERYKPLADSAIELTAGMIVEYDGQPARCFFHSTCGGHTENVQHIWQGQPALPYLAGVSDIDSATGQPFCLYSPQFYWAVTYTSSELNNMVSTNLGTANPVYANRIAGRPQQVIDLEVSNRFESYRVDTLRIIMKNGDVYYVRGDRTRYLFKNSDGTILKSSLFRILITRNDNGSIKDVIVKGQGSGHGVGMCQWGTLGMSRLGYNYLQILSHYYPGTIVKKEY